MRIAYVLLACFGFAGFAPAAENYVDPGAYYDRGAPGTGVLIDDGPGEKVFGAWFGYTPAGESMFLTFGGQFAIPADGGSPVLDAQLFASRDGQCLGCPYRQPVTTSAPERIHIEAPTPRHLQVTIAGQSWLMEGMEIDVATVNLPIGIWDMRLADNVIGTPIVVDSLVSINSIAPLSLELRRGSGDAALPPPGGMAAYFEMLCLDRCSEFEAWRTGAVEFIGPDNGRRVIVWYDIANRRSGIELVESDGKVLAARRAFTLSVGENYMTGKPLRFYLQFNNVFARPDDPAIRLAMTRRLQLPSLSTP